MVIAEIAEQSFLQCHATKENTVLLLGGYGCVGRAIARLLLKETQADLVIAGRRQALADKFAARLRVAFSCDRVSSRHIDASNLESLPQAFRGVDIVIVLTPTPELVRQIGRAALDSGCNYMDILANESTVQDLEELAPSVREQRRVFITQAGFHPGLPAVFVRRGARCFDQYDKANIAMAMNARIERPEQSAEFIPLVANFTGDICRDGSWRNATYRDAVTFDMGSQFGTITLYPMKMAEIKQTQKMFNLNDMAV